MVFPEDSFGTTSGGESFGLVVWGWDSFVSYRYPGGFNVDWINLN